MPALAAGGPKIGTAAPDFTGLDSQGQKIRLADLRGKTVVLEWTNDGCPYVRKWYSSGAMPTRLLNRSANDVRDMPTAPARSLTFQRRATLPCISFSAAPMRRSLLPHSNRSP